MATSTDSMAQDILTCRLRANEDRKAGNHVQAAGWDAEADALEQRIITLEQHHG